MLCACYGNFTVLIEQSCVTVYLVDICEFSRILNYVSWVHLTDISIGELYI